MSALSVRLPLQTERLVLRTHRAEDLDDLVVFHGDPEVVRYVPWPLRDRTATEQTLRVKLDQGELREPGQWLVLAVELRETGRVIGEVLLKWASDRQGELGFAFARDVQGQGYAAEAGRAMVAYAFSTLSLRRIVATTEHDNLASQGVMRAIGMRLERNPSPDPPWMQVVGIKEYEPSG